MLIKVINQNLIGTRIKMKSIMKESLDIIKSSMTEYPLIAISMIITQIRGTVDIRRTKITITIMIEDIIRIIINTTMGEINITEMFGTTEITSERIETSEMKDKMVIREKRKSTGIITTDKIKIIIMKEMIINLKTGIIIDQKIILKAITINMIIKI